MDWVYNLTLRCRCLAAKRVTAAVVLVPTPPAALLPHFTTRTRGSLLMNRRPFLALFLILLALILGSVAAAAISPQVTRNEPPLNAVVPSQRASAQTPAELRCPATNRKPGTAGCTYENHGHCV